MHNSTKWLLLNLALLFVLGACTQNAPSLKSTAGTQPDASNLPVPNPDFSSLFPRCGKPAETTLSVAPSISYVRFDENNGYDFSTSMPAYSMQSVTKGDFDGDGVDTLAFLDLATLDFFMRNDHGSGKLAARVKFTNKPTIVAPGTPEFSLRRPISGDLDGDKKDELGIFDATTSKIFWQNGQTTSVQGIPVIGDFHNHCRDVLATVSFANSELIIPAQGNAAAKTQKLASIEQGSIPLAMDFDGDGQIEVVFEKNGVIKNTRGDARVFKPAKSLLSWMALSGHFGQKIPAYRGATWLTATSVAQGFDPVKLDQGFEKASKLARSQSLLLIRNGRLVREGYSNGFESGMPQNIKSVSKSIVSLVMGTLVDRNEIAVTRKVSEVYPTIFANVADTRKLNMTVRDLMTMRSGLQLNDQAHVTEMARTPNPVQFMFSQPFKDPNKVGAGVGVDFNYSTVMTHVGSKIIQTVTGKKTSALARERIFAALGIINTRWDTSDDGTDFGGSEIFMRPRDMARLGQLILDGGMANGQRIVSANYLSDATATQVANAGNGNQYGYWWWKTILNGYEVKFASGFGGQFIFVVEDLDIVVVRTGSNYLDPSADVTAQLAATRDAIFEIIANDIIGAVLADAQ